MRDKRVFRFKQFSVAHDNATMKVGTDGVLLGAWTLVDEAKRILDVGTGTGVIALILAQRSSRQAHIDAIDISMDAFRQACTNIHHSPWPTKIRVYHSALQDFEATPYDLIVSNPPYFNNSYKPPEALRTQARHTETLSHEALLQHTKRLLAPGGKLNLILPVAEGNLLLDRARQMDWYCSRQCTFRSRKEKPAERLLLELQLQATPMIEQELTLYEKDEAWSADYQKLTRDFYLKI
ncbi:MAG TPA: methyltransferase [Cyclobacteriaceae bacterium]|nr:methyltransferase [Cyclobacteriaceae bacterium]